MRLSEIPDTIQWPKSHYVYLEKKGPFQITAQACWMELHRLMPEIVRNNTIIGAAALYKIEPEMIYRAGMILKEVPVNLPNGILYDVFPGGEYSRFTLMGSYMQLPEACGKVFEMVKARNIQVRNDFYIEHYVNDPKTTPEEQLVTEILVPSNG